MKVHLTFLLLHQGRMEFYLPLPNLARHREVQIQDSLSNARPKIRQVKITLVSFYRAT
jgi:hypothetical protein